MISPAQPCWLLKVNLADGGSVPPDRAPVEARSERTHLCLVRPGKGCYAEPGAPLLISLPLDTGADEMCKRDELLQTLFTHLGMQRSLRLLLCIVAAVLTLATKQMIDAALLEFINTLDSCRADSSRSCRPKRRETQQQIKF